MGNTMWKNVGFDVESEILILSQGPLYLLVDDDMGTPYIVFPMKTRRDQPSNLILGHDIAYAAYHTIYVNIDDLCSNMHTDEDDDLAERLWDLDSGPITWDEFQEKFPECVAKCVEAN